MPFEESNNDSDNLEIKKSTIVEFYNQHRLHRRKHSVQEFTDKNSLSGKTGYSMIFCLTCQTIYCVDVFEINDANNILEKI